ncbi:MAG: M23 family metallopeptidase [Sphingomonas sp.]|uniref:M23 family metallopeptidase n=1 Tax=Sphingomonas sp. TaxID=28214 RepID=UPI0011F8A9CA|nr:M23 family metallopeptidase [Sphingomonas sp.]THD36720.1 MAG: M23 family metallopeptidase [Sphingomonas sp.]
MRSKLSVVVALLLSGCIPAGQDYGPPDSGYAPPPQDRDYPPERYDPQRADEDVPAPPSAPPAWVAQPVTPDARTIPDSTYVVQPGDTLRGIAEKVGAGSETIADANDLSAPFIVRPGQQLHIPGGRYHFVRPGESGIAIARAYGVRWADIVAANNLEEPYILRAGRRILIPGGAPARPQTLAERAAAFKIDLGDIATGGGEPAIPETERAPRAASVVRRPLPSSVPIATPGALNGPFLWPVSTGNVVKRFGAGASGERNDGIKIAVPVGTSIKAVADGVVIYTATSVAGLGGLVMVKHGDGWTSVYGHASRILVQRGQAVRRGQSIALSGDTGFADRPELHFELRKGRVPVDPLTKLPRR